MGTSTDTSQSSSRRLHFRITGEAVTRIARDHFLSDRPDLAWRLLTTGLAGDEGALVKAARGVLSGTKKIVGDESAGLRVVADKAKKYQRDARFIYAGRIRLDSRWFQPRAVVVEYGSRDNEFAALARGARRGEPSRDNGSAARRDLRTRTQYYAGEGERVVDCGAHGFVIFEPTGERPHWWEPVLTPAAAVEEAQAAGRTLDEERAEPLSEDDPPWSEGRVPPLLSFESTSAAELERLEAQYAREDAEYEANLAKYASVIRARAGDAWIDLRTRAGDVVAKVPVAPFAHWALRRTTAKHLAPPWEPVCPSGLKMPCDDEFHTDWFVGAGFDPRTTNPYVGPINEAALATMGEMQEMFAQCECTILVAGPEVEGVVGQGIVVLPDLHPDHLPRLTGARAVITEAGGALAHLAQVALERNLPIVVVPDARARFPAGARVRVDATEGRVVLEVESRY